MSFLSDENVNKNYNLINDTVKFIFVSPLLITIKPHSNLPVIDLQNVQLK